ncbi:hypothetical protein [Sulfolobus sp. E11-6]|uniref:hypothetical protein n=1 Tax=Sulfolobus sp. E11-6 TaxID=2663020 RepID=UPI001296EB54|nr:hypothetical protein [Sulfolobus sp. E11-6]QGA68900.1 hypothetical protein GFS33_09360 [Sulfolobus sp. E11-6]
MHYNSDFEELYYSNDYEKILSFYYKFEDVEDIVEWLKNRPEAERKIYEFEGDSEVVFVIPTSDVNNQFSNYIKRTFKKYHLIFVESRGRYFNFSKSVNEGVKIAMKYKPKYVIISNDDIKVDNVDSLMSEILSEDNREVKAMIAGEGKIK